MLPIWIVRLEVLAYIDAAPDRGVLGFLNVVAAGSDSIAAEQKVIAVLKKYEWEIIGVEDVSVVDLNKDYPDDTIELIEKVTANPHFVLLSTLHGYKSN